MNEHDTTSQPSVPRSGKPLAPENLRYVIDLARDLFAEGLQAGGGYAEVWIRDLASVMPFAAQVVPAGQLREALLNMLRFQQEDGAILDGYVAASDHHPGHNKYTCPDLPGLVGHKNTCETDQETSLVIAVDDYVAVTGDAAILDEMIDGRLVRQRLFDAMAFLQNHRTAAPYGLLWCGCNIDWGDLQLSPGCANPRLLDEHSHPAVSPYANLLYVDALQRITDRLVDDPREQMNWKIRLECTAADLDRHLWDERRRKFIPHLFLDRGSPFPDDFDVTRIHYHGSNAVAAQAKLLDRERLIDCYEQMKRNAAEAGAASIGITPWPLYPVHEMDIYAPGPYHYQNGGDWPWFSLRMVLGLLNAGETDRARRAMTPMMRWVLRDGDFFEWYTLAGEPRGSNRFRGMAGLLALCCQRLLSERR